MTGTSSAPSTGWRLQYERLSAITLDELPPTDLERLAEAAFWVGRPRESVAAYRRLYQLHRASGDADHAALTAWRLFNAHFDLDETAAANGWLRRAQRHVPANPNSREGGYICLGCAEWARYVGRLDDAAGYARVAIEVGDRTGDVDLATLGRAMHARILVTDGQVIDGMDLLDEAMLEVVSGELTALTSGWVYCLLLHVCHEVGDVRRAAEWTDLAMRWCEQLTDGGYYRGMCRIHQCEIRSHHGSWADAEDDARQATEEVAPFGRYMAAEGHYLVGEIRRLRGDFDGAEEAFARARDLGKDPQPGLAMLQLARGDVDEAAAALRVAFARGGVGQAAQARLLAARLEVELRAGQVDAARASADQLHTVAQSAGTPLLEAMATTAHGTTLLAEGDAAAALAVMHDACLAWEQLSLPYESAHTRMLLGTAARAAGDEYTAHLEIEAARSAFERLGAVPAAGQAAALLADGHKPPGGLTGREVEVLRLVARGQSNRDIATALVISEHTVARHLSNIFHKLDVTSRAAATAFAFEHDLVSAGL